MKFTIRLLLAAILALGLLFPRAFAQTQFQFPTAPWQAYAPTRIQCGQLYGANFNVVTDQPITISVPSGIWMLDSIEVDEVYPAQTAVSLTTAQGGVYTGAGKTGVTLVASTQAYSTITNATANTISNAMLMTMATGATTTVFQGFAQASKVSTIYFALTTGQGAAAAANIRVFCRNLF